MATIPEALALAIQHHQGGRLQAAEQIYRQILQVDPNHAEAIRFLGVMASQVGQHDVAIEFLKRAIGLNADVAAFHDNLGGVYLAVQRIPEAVASFHRALELAPDHAVTHYNLGVAYGTEEKLGEAIACYRRALELQPDFAGAHCNLGVAFEDQGNVDDAVACYRRALQLKPDYPEAWRNLGNALKAQGKRDEAEASYAEALRLRPNYDAARFSLSLLWLLRGDFARGWPAYECRWSVAPVPPARFSQPCWDGAPLHGKTILLYSEQGLGDTLMFVRYASLVKERGGRVLLECQPELARLLEHGRGIDAVTPRGVPLAPFDVQVALMSLPGLFGTDLTNIPADIPYLHAVAADVERWRDEFRRWPGLKVGIIWQGNPRFAQPDCRPIDRKRSFPLAHFEPLTKIPGVRSFSLQKGYGAEQLTSFGQKWGIIDLGDRLHDFADTAAVLMNLDLIISADTSPAHLAGALGRPVWTVLPFAGCWRWLVDRDDSPWYPTMRLFRQEKAGDWPGVFRRVAGELARLANDAADQ